MIFFCLKLVEVFNLHVFLVLVLISIILEATLYECRCGAGAWDLRLASLAYMGWLKKMRRQDRRRERMFAQAVMARREYEKFRREQWLARAVLARMDNVTALLDTSCQVAEARHKAIKNKCNL